MKSSLLIASLLCTLLPAGCGGTETGNPGQPGGPLSHFESTTCKSEMLTPQSTPGETRQALVAASDYDGLQCVEWERGAKEGDLTLRLINFPGGCGVTWDGAAARRSDGSVELELINTKCQVFKCGSCLYDARYDLTGIASSSTELTVHVGYVDCPTMGDVRWQFDIALGLGTEPSGILCRYAPLGSVLKPTVCSGKNLLCGANAGICGGMACSAGLACTEITAGDQRCLQPCTTNADCTPAATMACTDGLCRLARTW